MPHAGLRLTVIDLVAEPSPAPVRIRITRAEGGGGGQVTTATLPAGRSHVTVTDIPCGAGDAGTTVLVALTSRHFRPYKFLQRLQADLTARANEHPVRLAVKPSAVAGIDAPVFSRLPARARRVLRDAAMLAEAPEDADLEGLAGAALYGALGPLRQACLLNVLTKAGHASADRCGRFVRGALVLRQDRCFYIVDERMERHLNDSERFISAPDALHEPLAGYRMLGRSYKSKDSHANLQVTLMQHMATGAFAADIDIDEASGFRHGLEVIRNKVTGGRTNPYLIRELLLLRDPAGRSLDPGYRFLLEP